MARFNYDSYVKREANKESSSKDFKVTYFGLKDDGDEAVVRFIYDSTDQFHLVAVHTVDVGGKPRKINCLRTGYDSLDICPFCKEGLKIQNKMYVKLLEYTTNEKGEVEYQAKVWERPAVFSRTLQNMLQEYGPLSNSIFKVKRSGKRGDTDTTYDILYANPVVYKHELYKKDFSAFDNYDLNKYFYLDKTATDMIYYLENSEFPATATTTLADPVVVEKSPKYTENEAGPTKASLGITVTNLTPIEAPTPQTNFPGAVTAQANDNADPTIQRPRRYTY